MITFDGRDLLVHIKRSAGPEIKQDLGGSWDTKARAWRLAPIALNVLRLVDWYGESILDGADDDIRALVEQPWGFYGFSDEERQRAEEHPSWSTLFEHQREGVEYAYCNPHSAWLAMLSWGMGKGAVTVVTADLLDAQRILVLAPLTLAPAWIDEFTRWSDRARDIKRAVAGDREPGLEVTIANHEVIQELVLRTEERELIQPDWVTNARRVKEWINEGPKKIDAKSRKEVPIRERIVRVRRDYVDMEWDLICVDESVLLKNRKAVKVNVLEQLRKRSNPAVALLSGSPITKHADDLHPQLRIMMPRGFKSYWRFAEFFCVVDRDGWGWTIEGDRAAHDPHHYLRDFLWVKSQDDALPDLPEYITQHVALEATPQQRRALDTMLDEWIVELEDDPEEMVVADNWLSRLTRLQQITSNLGSLPKPNGGFYPKASAKEDLLIDLLRQGDIKAPLLVWTWFKETTFSVIDRLTRATELAVSGVTGEDSREQKDATIAAYKNGQLPILVMQMGVGKFGHTFTHTRTVYYHDRPFDSDAWVQSLHRVRRIGLEHRPVLIVPKVRTSADELIDENLEGKLTSMARMTNADLARLLRSLSAPAS